MSPSPEGPLAGLADLVGVIEVARGAALVEVDAGTPLADCGLDSLAWVLVGVLLADHGAPLADDDWADLRTVGDLWRCYTFRLTNPAP